jgi:hypothetical protein
MSQQRLSAANIARQEATQALVGGIGQVAGGVMKANPAAAAMGAQAGSGKGISGFIGNLFK